MNDSTPVTSKPQCLEHRESRSFGAEACFR